MKLFNLHIEIGWWTFRELDSMQICWFLRCDTIEYVLVHANVWLLLPPCDICGQQYFYVRNKLRMRCS